MTSHVASTSTPDKKDSKHETDSCCKASHVEDVSDLESEKEVVKEVVCDCEAEENIGGGVVSALRSRSSHIIAHEPKHLVSLCLVGDFLINSFDSNQNQQ